MSVLISAVGAPSGCLLDDRARRDGVALAVGSSCGVPAGKEPAGPVSRPGVPSQSYQKGAQ